MWVNEEFRASQEETAHASSRLFFEAFESMKGTHSALRRADLDLKQVKRLVPHLFIAEQHGANRDFRWRLAGTGVCALMGGEMTGLSFASGWADDEASKIRRVLSSVSASHQPALIRMRFITDQGQAITAEMAAVPLMSADGKTTQVLGGLFAFADAGLKHFNALTGRELVSARADSGEAVWAASGEAQPQQRFRVITGGREG